MKPLFIGSIGVITRSPDRGRKFFVQALGLDLERSKGTDFLATQRLPGSKYFGVWPLSEAARTCYGTDQWPTDRPTPQAFIEFEVDRPTHVARAASEFEAKGYSLLHAPRTDPWGQTVVRLQTDDGLIVGISYVPWMHRRAKPTVRRAPRARRRSK